MKLTDTITTPAYVVYEDRLRHNLETIREVAENSEVEIIMALKANALWRTFPLMKPYVKGATASSINEMMLAREYLTDNIHAFAPVYSHEDFLKFAANCSHITFNSLRQYEAHKDAIANLKGTTSRMPSFGLRVNPQCSVIETDMYNPCLPGSRFGMSADKLPAELPSDIEGFHFHALCESDSYALEKVLIALEEQFGHWLPRLKWLNMGGGHLMTRADYNRNHLAEVLGAFKKRHPNLHLIMEPGSAFTWRTGDLMVSVLDIVEDGGIKTAIIDASFACHMPDCLEMPYRPRISEAKPDEHTSSATDSYEYRLGGNSCLSGDFAGTWRFANPLEPGQRLTLEDMNHYTNVKTTMFNGLQHPSVYLIPSADDHGQATPLLLRRYTYEDYRDRMC